VELRDHTECWQTSSCSKAKVEIQLGLTGFPRGIESNEKILNCEIGFKDLEKVLKLATMHIKY